MDIPHLVAQLARDIDLLEAQLSEKKADLKKLWATLSPQEQLLIDSPSTEKLKAPANEQPAASEAKLRHKK